MEIGRTLGVGEDVVSIIPFSWIVLVCLDRKQNPNFDGWFHHLTLKKQKPAYAAKTAQSSAREEETSRHLLGEDETASREKIASSMSTSTVFSPYS